MNAKPPCVLVVDDNDDHRLITTHELKRMRTSPKAEVQAVDSGAKAMEQMRRLFADHRRVLLISDYRMPEMDGLELLKELKRSFPEGDARFVIFSSTEPPIGPREELQKEADEVRVKPVDLDTFRNELHDILRNWNETREE